jgi:hypothetical protein
MTMRNFHIATVIGTLLTLIPAPALAKKADNDPFKAFEEELLQTSGLDESDEKALKQIRKCGKFDHMWQVHLEDPRTYALHDTRDDLRSSVACWEKVQKKNPTGNEAVDDWVVQWSGFVKGVELWVWARMAIETGDRDNFCTRIASAEEQLKAVAETAVVLPDKFVTAEGKDLANSPYVAVAEVYTVVHKHREDSGCE